MDGQVGAFGKGIGSDIPHAGMDHNIRKVRHFRMHQDRFHITDFLNLLRNPIAAADGPQGRAHKILICSKEHTGIIKYVDIHSTAILHRIPEHGIHEGRAR